MRICKDGRIWGQNNSYHNPEYIRKQREANSGPKHHNWKGGKSLLRKIRKHKSQKYYLFSKENLEKLKGIGIRNKNGRNNPMYGKRHSTEAKIKMSEKKKKIYLRENNPNWQGGISFLPYSPEFNDQLKDKIRKRDEHRCQLCFKHQNELRNQNNKSYKLIVHHINLNKNNNNSDNLISLCRECHLKIHYNNQININNFPFKNKLTEVFLR